MPWTGSLHSTTRVRMQPIEPKHSMTSRPKPSQALKFKPLVLPRPQWPEGLYVSAEAVISALTRRHLAQLAHARLAMVKPNAFGVEKSSSAWERFVDEFIVEIVWPALSQAQQGAVLRAGYSETFTRLIDAVAAAEADRMRGASGSAEVHLMDGVQYEHYCAQVLVHAGWEATVTRATGDQGADVLARKGERRVAMQCKKYSSPVGNAAVQEVHAARTYWGATHSAVVTNAGYTKAAHDLAHRTGVVLLHHSDLPRLTEILASHS